MDVKNTRCPEVHGRIEMEPDSNTASDGLIP